MLIQQFGLDNSIKMTKTAHGILIHPKESEMLPKRKARQDWTEQLIKAISNGDKPDEELL